MRIVEADLCSSGKYDQRNEERITALLGAWKGNNTVDLPVPVLEHQALVADFILKSDVWPPAGSTQGLRLRLDFLKNGGVQVPSINDLIASGVYRFWGQRGIQKDGCRARLPHEFNETKFCWALTRCVDDRSDVRVLINALRTRFRTVQWYGSRVVACEPIGQYGPEVPVLTASLIGGADVDVVLAWKRLISLNLQVPVGRSLPRDAARRLMKLVSAELLTDRAAITWHTDFELWAFFNGNAEVVPRLLADFRVGTRCAELMWFSLHSGHIFRPEGNDYWIDLACSLAVLTYDSELSDCISQLPVGACLCGLLEDLSRLNPSHLGLLLKNPLSIGPAAFAIHGLEWQRNGSFGVDVDLRQEWFEVEGYTRDVLVRDPWGCSSEPSLYELALDLAEDDEKVESRNSRNSSCTGRTPISLERRMAPWREFVADPQTNIQKLVVTLIGRLKIEPSYARFVVTARLLETISNVDTDHASELANALVASYDSLSEKCDVPDLTREGSLIRSLYLCPVADNTRRANIILPPELLKVLFCSDETAVVQKSSAVANHLHNLVAMAEFADEVEIKEIFDAIIRIRTRMKALNQWNWLFLAKGDSFFTDRPFLVRLGRVLTRHLERGREFVRSIKASSPEAVELAFLLSGTGIASDLAEPLKELLPNLVKNLLQPGQNPCLGLLEDLIRELATTSQWDEVDLCRNEVETCLKVNSQRFNRLDMDSHQRVAVEAKCNVLLARKEYAAILELPTDWGSADTRSLVYAYRGLARYSSGEPGAEVEFRRALKEHGRNILALTNLPFLSIVQGDFDRALSLIAEARLLLGDSAPERLFVYEAYCHYHLGLYEKALEIIKGLSRKERQSPDAVLLKMAFIFDHSLDFDSLRADLVAIRRTNPDLATMIETKIAPMSHFELAGPMTFSSECQRVSFEVLCSLAGFPDSADMLLRNLQAVILDLVRHPSLVAGRCEDVITDLIGLCLEAKLQRFRVSVQMRTTGGHGRKFDGEPDLVIASELGVIPERWLLIGEAKLWNGPSTVQKALDQLFGFANTGETLVNVVLLYFTGNDFCDAVTKVSTQLTEYRQTHGDADAFISKEVKELPSRAPNAVRSFRSIHQISTLPSEAANTTIVHTLLIDFKTARASQSRRCRD